MKFTSTDNGPAVYVRFKNKDYTVPTYVGETKECYGGRPFRKNARGSKWQGTIKYKSIIVIKCPENRLKTREAYFVLHHFPIYQRKQLARYLKKAWHLVTQKKLAEVLRLSFEKQKENFDYPNWENLQSWISSIEHAEDKEELRALMNDFMVYYV